MSDLDDVINNKQPEPEAAETPEVETPEADPVEVAKEEKPEVVEPAKADTTPMVPVAALTEVRRELQELKALQPKPQAQPAPDVFDDPAGYQKHMQQTLQHSVTNVKLDISEEMTRQQYGDDLVDKAFASLQAQANPALQQSFMQARNPWGELVKWHNKQEISREFGDDPAAYREKLKAELMGEIKAEMVAEQAKSLAGKAAPSMANVTGTGGGPKTNWTGPTPLDSVIGD